MTHPTDDFARDVPPDVLAAGDRVRMWIEKMIGDAPVALVATAYRRGRDDALGGAPDLGEAALKLTAKAVKGVRPGVSEHEAYVVIQSLLALGWRPPPPVTEGCTPEGKCCEFHQDVEDVQCCNECPDGDEMKEAVRDQS